MPNIPAETAAAYQPVRAPRGPSLSCKGWQQEAALRMLTNSLDADVAERPSELVACGALGKVTGDWHSFHAAVAALRALETNETLFVRDGKPAGVFRTREGAPRVLIMDSDPAASWAYIGPQGFLPGAYELLAAAGRKHFGGDLGGKLIASGGLGGAGGALPLAATMNGAAFLGVDVDPERIKRRVKTGYCDVMVNDLDEALRILKNAVRKREAASVGLVGNCADVMPELARRGVVPDLLTHQTNAAGDYVPRGMSAAEAAELRRSDAQSYRTRVAESIALYAEGMAALQKLGSILIDLEYLEPALREGRAPIHWVALSGEPADIQRMDRLLLELFAENEDLSRWIRAVLKRVRYQGLPARACWLGAEERSKFGAAVNEMVARGELKAPVVFLQDSEQFALNGLAAARNQTPHESPPEVTDSIELEVLLELANGATWAAFDHDAAKSGAARLTMQAVVADGTNEMNARIERVLADELSR
jgi:urocanate hydratase